MKTETQEAKTITVFETLDELFNAAKPHQVTGQEILNERSHVFGQWQEIKIAPALREQVIDKIIESAGGRYTTRAAIRRTLERETPQHWSLDRFLLSKYGDSPARLSYCAGQDQTWEMRELRNKLK